MGFTNTRFPTSPFIEQATGRPSREWIIWLQNPNFVKLSTNEGIGINSGGTGLVTLPNDGELLIGNNGIYSLGTLTPGAGISIINCPGSIVVENAGVLSWSGGLTGLTPSDPTTGDVVLAGVLNAASGGTGQSSYTIGDLLYASGTTELSKLADVATGNVLLSGGVGVAPAWGKVELSSLVTPNHITGTLQPGNGGTGQTSYANGQLLIGNGTGLTKSTLTAGANITITNGAGSITISATASTGATGSFITADTPAKTVTVVNGIITAIV